MVWLRWFFVPVSPAMVVVLVFMTARAATLVTNDRCSDLYRTGGLCVEGWHTTAMDLIVYLSMFALAVGFVILPSLIAPRFKKVIAVLGLILVSILPAFANIRLGWPDLMLPLIIVLVAGCASVAWVWWKAGSNKYV